MKYLKEIIIIIFQILLFYITPYLTNINDPIGMIVFMILITFILSIIVGFSSNIIIYFYPIIISFIFIPSVFIFYNESALVHAIWYLIDSYLGIIIGHIFYMLYTRYMFTKV